MREIEKERKERVTKVRLKRHKKEIEKLNERTYKAGYKRRKRKKKN